MDNLWFQKITIRITQIGLQDINVQQILIVTLEFTGAARGFMIRSCAARGVQKVGQHCSRTYLGHFPLDISSDIPNVLVHPVHICSASGNASSPLVSVH